MPKNVFELVDLLGVEDVILHQKKVDMTRISWGKMDTSAILPQAS